LKKTKTRMKKRPSNEGKPEKWCQMVEMKGSKNKEETDRPVAGLASTGPTSCQGEKDVVGGGRHLRLGRREGDRVGKKTTPALKPAGHIGATGGTFLKEES